MCGGHLVLMLCCGIVAAMFLNRAPLIPIMRTWLFRIECRAMEIYGYLMSV